MTRKAKHVLPLDDYLNEKRPGMGSVSHSEHVMIV